MLLRLHLGDAPFVEVVDAKETISVGPSRFTMQNRREYARGSYSPTVRIVPKEAHWRQLPGPPGMKQRLDRAFPLQIMARWGACGKTPIVGHDLAATSSRVGVAMPHSPKPFEPHESGAYLHGTKADLEVGDLLLPGRTSNYQEHRVMNHVYVTKTLDAAVWGAEMARGDGRCRVYVVEPEGAVEDDPNVTDKKLPGNPTMSYRTREPVRIVGELTDWVGHSEEQLTAMQDGLAELRRRGLDVIYD